MREILFRGKSKWDSKWIYGCLVELGKESFSDPDRYGITDKGIPLGNTDVCFNFKVHEVVPKTIGEYTGAMDRYNVKIFEGDVLSIPSQIAISPYEEVVQNYVNGIVYFDGIRHMWYVHLKDQADISIWELDESDIVIVGNIHDNPKLMEVNSNDRN